MAAQRKAKRKASFSTVHPHAAGIDIGSGFHVVAVAPDREEEPVRTFQSFPGDLHRMADWLSGVGITTIAMESTGVYWIPAYEILEERGFEVLLLNARDSKNVPGRKTDVNDAQWLRQLHQFGLLRGSFRPTQEIVTFPVPPTTRSATVNACWPAYVVAPKPLVWCWWRTRPPSSKRAFLRKAVGIFS